tara:strand:+ start:44 stop:196 length:153 start_codon:yes stop_codon:yes gene_type:complete
MNILTKEQYCYSELRDRLIHYHGDDDHVEWIEDMYDDYVQSQEEKENESK